MTETRLFLLLGLSLGKLEGQYDNDWKWLDEFGFITWSVESKTYGLTTKGDEAVACAVKKADELV